jgi:hypothetical protein
MHKDILKKREEMQAILRCLRLNPSLRRKELPFH